MGRKEVYAAIDSERSYQNDKWGTIEQRPKQVGAWLTLMRVMLAEAETAWADSSSDLPALHSVRKLAAVGVACMEQHGVAPRKTTSAVLQVQSDWQVKTLE